MGRLTRKSDDESAEPDFKKEKKKKRKQTQENQNHGYCFFGGVNPRRERSKRLDRRATCSSPPNQQLRSRLRQCAKLKTSIFHSAHWTNLSRPVGYSAAVLPVCVADGRTCPFGSPGLRSKASWTYYFSVPLIKLLRLELYFYNLFSLCVFFLFLSFFL